MPLQGISSGVFKFSTTTQNRQRTSIPGTMAISVDDNNTITGDFRVHDGLTPGGISNPPPGTVSHIITKYDSNFTDNISEPDGWFFCDGREVSIAEYNALYQAIGTHWNEGTVTSGSYKIPDLRNHYIRCTTGAVGVSQKQDAVIQKHSHWMLTQYSGGHQHNYTPWLSRSMGSPGLYANIDRNADDSGNYAPNVYILYTIPQGSVSTSSTSVYDTTGMINQPLYNSGGGDPRDYYIGRYTWMSQGIGAAVNYITHGTGPSNVVDTEHHHDFSLSNQGDTEVDMYHVKLATFIKY